MKKTVKKTKEVEAPAENFYLIKVNGKVIKWKYSSILYREVVELSGLSPKKNKPLVVTYKNGVHHDDGEIHERCSALIKPKMLFFVK